VRCGWLLLGYTAVVLTLVPLDCIKCSQIELQESLEFGRHGQF
jgi:hypothetical protein